MKKTLFTLFAASLGLASNASMANTIAFDGIELGKTTCQDYMAKHADLRFTHKNGVYSTDARAFNIPATEIELGCGEISDPIVGVIVHYSSGDASEADKLFLPALKKKFGKPKKQEHHPFDDQLIEWETKDAVIGFTHKFAVGGTVYYATKELVNRFNNFVQNEQKKRQSAVENTL